ncbi:MAG: hypothetical protein ACKO0M_05430 [Cyanobium sp.]
MTIVSPAEASNLGLVIQAIPRVPQQHSRPGKKGFTGRFAGRSDGDDGPQRFGPSTRGFRSVAQVRLVVGFVVVAVVGWST